ncbi:cytochrome P450 [Corynascus similis CBS 632.67]
MSSQVLALTKLVEKAVVAGNIRQLLVDLLSYKCHDFAKPRRIAAFLRLIIGDGFITLEEDKHNEVANGASNESKGSAVLKLTAWTGKVTLDIIGIAGMGREINAVEKASDPLQELYEELLGPDWERIVYAALNLAIGNHTVNMLPWKLNKLFSNDFDDEVFKDPLLTFLAVGHETTASALTWSAYLLAKYPEIQKTLRDEASDPSTDLVNLLKQMPYLNDIMHETLRLYPTVPVTMREALRNTSVSEQFIPKGTEMVVSIWQMNRSPEIWGQDTGEFRPERWINADDGKANRHSGAKSNYDSLTFL